MNKTGRSVIQSQRAHDEWYLNGGREKAKLRCWELINEEIIKRELKPKQELKILTTRESELPISVDDIEVITVKWAVK